MKFSGTVILFISMMAPAIFAQPGRPSTFLDSEDIMPDQVGAAITENLRLSPDEIKKQKDTFFDFITKYRSNRFTGTTQYVFSVLNLNTPATVIYSKALDGTIRFQLASNAGNTGNSDVVFPTEGAVYFEILNRDGNPKEYKTNDGQVISFVGTKNTLYIVETEASFEKRDKVQAKHNREGKATGRYLAIANYDLFKQSIEFYEIENSNGEKTLARRGFFVGRAIRP